MWSVICLEMVVKYLVERSSAVYSPREKLNRCVGVLLLIIVPLINYPCIKTISVSQPVTCEADTKRKKFLSALHLCTALTKLNGKKNHREKILQRCFFLPTTFFLELDFQFPVVTNCRALKTSEANFTRIDFSWSVILFFSNYEYTRDHLRVILLCDFRNVPTIY